MEEVILERNSLLLQISYAPLRPLLGKGCGFSRKLRKHQYNLVFRIPSEKYTTIDDCYQFIPTIS